MVAFALPARTVSLKRSRLLWDTFFKLFGLTRRTNFFVLPFATLALRLEVAGFFLLSMPRRVTRQATPSLAGHLALTVILFPCNTAGPIRLPASADCSCWSLRLPPEPPAEPPPEPPPPAPPPELSTVSETLSKRRLVVPPSRAVPATVELVSVPIESASTCPALTPAAWR